MWPINFTHKAHAESIAFLVAMFTESIRLKPGPNVEIGFTDYFKGNSICNSAVNNLHIAVKHPDELMKKMQTRLHSPLENRVEVFYQNQSGNIYKYHNSSKLQIDFINAMNAAKSATNNLLIDLQQLKLELVVDQI
ncbi:unnamed protein product [Fasciola hepatica]|uniref:Uncharacterized protein n=1 Tax=Fasciola hepatica TaxID=6192 RepID=A0ABC9HIJ5_FASHE